MTYHTIQDIADACGVTKRWVEYWLHKLGHHPSIMLGHTAGYGQDALDAMQYCVRLHAKGIARPTVMS
jgi:hypothetical protein